MLKYSKQRESIKNYLNSHRTHPTAETIYSDIKENFPSISLGTVYRNLNLLADMGEISRISFGGGPDRYDGNTKPHYHVICTRCNKILDIEMEHQTQLDALANELFEGTVSSHVTHFFGLCPKCCKSKKK